MKIQGKNPIDLNIAEIALQKAQKIRQDKAEEGGKEQKSEKINKNVPSAKTLQTKDAVEISKESRIAGTKENISQTQKQKKAIKIRQIESELAKSRQNQREQQYQKEVNLEREGNKQINGAMNRIAKERKDSPQHITQSGNETFEKRAQNSRNIRDQEIRREEQNKTDGRNNGPVNLLA